MPRLACAVVFSVLVSVSPLAGADDRGEGTMILGDSAISMVAAFAYSGEQIDYDENGKELPHYELLLLAEPFDRQTFSSSDGTISDFNEWMYVEEPATIEIHLDPTLRPTFVKANAKGQFHADRTGCGLEKIFADVKLVDGRLRGRIQDSGAGVQCPEGQKLAFDVSFDVTVEK